MFLGWYGHLMALYKTKLNWVTWSPPKYVLPIVFSWYPALRIFWNTKWQIKLFKRFKIYLGQYITTNIWHIVGIMVPDIHANCHNQPIIMRRAIMMNGWLIITASVAEWLGRRTPWSCWRYGVRKVVSSIPGRRTIVGWVFHRTR